MPAVRVYFVHYTMHMDVTKCCIWKIFSLFYFVASVSVEEIQNKGQLRFNEMIIVFAKNWKRLNPFFLLYEVQRFVKNILKVEKNVDSSSYCKKW